MHDRTVYNVLNTVRHVKNLRNRLHIYKKKNPFYTYLQKTTKKGWILKAKPRFIEITLSYK